MAMKPSPSGLSRTPPFIRIFGVGLPGADEGDLAPPQQCLYFNPDPQGQGSFLPVFTITIFLSFPCVCADWILLWWIFRRFHVFADFDVGLELAIELEVDQVAGILFLATVADDKFSFDREQEVHIQSAQLEHVVIN